MNPLPLPLAQRPSHHPSSFALPRIAPALLAILALASSATADTLSGKVVDKNGVGVAGVVIDAEEVVSGDEANISNNVTDVNGCFNATIDPGFYDVIFRPPVGSLVSGRIVEDVTVVGASNMGTVVLPDGFSLSGRTVDEASNPVANVDLDAYDAQSGEEVPLMGDNTNAFGDFAIQVPPDVVVNMNTENVVGGVFAPQSQSLSLAGHLAVGDVVLPPGFVVTGSVMDTHGSPVVNADLDFDDSTTGEEAYTPGDNTDGSGFFSVVVEANTWDVSVCPTPSTPLAASESQDVVITSNTSLGTFVLQDGVSLFGTVTLGGSPVQGVDVDVNVSPGGASVALCRDSTNSSGVYSVFVPTGTYDVRFSTPTHVAIQAGVMVSGPTQVDGTLAPCVGATSVSRNGSGLNPVVLTSVAAPRLGRQWVVDLDCAGHAPALAGILVYAAPSTGPVTNLGEVLVKTSSPRFLRKLKSHSGNVLTFSTLLPPDTSFCGAQAYVQGIIFGDPAGELTNALDLVIGQ